MQRGASSECCTSEGEAVASLSTELILGMKDVTSPVTEDGLGRAAVEADTGTNKEAVVLSVT